MPEFTEPQRGNTRQGGRGTEPGGKNTDRHRRTPACQAEHTSAHLPSTLHTKPSQALLVFSYWSCPETSFIQQGPHTAGLLLLVFSRDQFYSVGPSHCYCWSFPETSFIQQVPPTAGLLQRPVLFSRSLTLLVYSRDQFYLAGPSHCYCWSFPETSDIQQVPPTAGLYAMSAVLKTLTMSVSHS